jgi:hypothetical protein
MVRPVTGERSPPGVAPQHIASHRHLCDGGLCKPGLGGRALMAPQRVGWYPDPNDNGAEVYWDGARWHGSRQKSIDE